MPLVKLYANLRQATGQKELELPGGTAGELIEALCRQYPLLREKLLDGDQLRPHFVVSLNGHNVALAEGLDTPVGPQDQLAIFPPIAGGWAGIDGNRSQR